MITPTRLTRLGIGMILGLGLSIQVPLASAAATPQKEWTVLVYLNGFNNLDRFGAEDINEMETVGSNDQTNIIVQWASLARRDVRRLYVTKDSDTNQVHSVELQNMGLIDMGSHATLSEFISWGAREFPARHIFVDVWNHGGGWHRMEVSSSQLNGGIVINDISYDDISGNRITTDQLGDSLRNAYANTHQRIDVLGMDACLMAMTEVGYEVSDTTDIMVASQDLEPGPGWPYGHWLQSWQSMSASPEMVAKNLVQEYYRSYTPGGSESDSEVTLSAVRLSSMKALGESISWLSREIQNLTPDSLTRAYQASKSALHFFNSDYVDLVDFLTEFEKKDPAAFQGRGMRDSSRAVRTALQSSMILNKATTEFEKATGLSIWLPTAAWMIDSYKERYQMLRFEQDQHWLAAIEKVFSGKPPAP